MAKISTEKGVLELLQAIKWYKSALLPSRLMKRREPTLTEELQREIKEYRLQNTFFTLWAWLIFMNWLCMNT